MQIQTEQKLQRLNIFGAVGMCEFSSLDGAYIHAGPFLLPNVMHVHTHKQKSTFFNLKLYSFF
jgi:hypothetical protein